MAFKDHGFQGTGEYKNPKVTDADVPCLKPNPKVVPSSPQQESEKRQAGDIISMHKGVGKTELLCTFLWEM